MSALTAITAQNTCGVTAVQAIDPDVVEAQIRAVALDIGVDAAKTGMLFSAPIIDCVAHVIRDLQALVLGLVQGATELLPISSSGHLILVPWLFDWTFLEQNDSFNQTFDVSLHLGTLVAVAAYFWHDLVALVTAWLGTLRRRSIRTTDERVAWLVVAATIPAGLIGYAFEDVIADHLGEPWQIAIFLALFGLLLGWADRRPMTRAMDELTVKQGLLVGLAQSLALMPGVSRSGITITAGRFLGLDRDSAARLSFLLLIPITFAAVVFKGVTDVLLADLPSGTAGPFVVGVLASLGSGLLAIVALLGYVRRHNYNVFVVYRLIVAALILLLIASGIRSATF
jgi:undecaprenyl-diphosphatase